MLIILPNHVVTNFFVQSIIIPLLLSSAYGFVAYDIFLDGSLLESFELLLENEEQSESKKERLNSLQKIIEQ